MIQIATMTKDDTSKTVYNSDIDHYFPNGFDAAVDASEAYRFLEWANDVGVPSGKGYAKCRAVIEVESKNIINFAIHGE